MRLIDTNWDRTVKIIDDQDIEGHKTFRDEVTFDNHVYFDNRSEFTDKPYFYDGAVIKDVLEVIDGSNNSGGTLDIEGTFDFKNSGNVKGLTVPVDDDDAATKKYVDDGFEIKVLRFEGMPDSSVVSGIEDGRFVLVG